MMQIWAFEAGGPCSSKVSRVVTNRPFVAFSPTSNLQPLNLHREGRVGGGG